MFNCIWLSMAKKYYVMLYICKHSHNHFVLPQLHAQCKCHYSSLTADHSFDRTTLCEAVMYSRHVWMPNFTHDWLVSCQWFLIKQATQARLNCQRRHRAPNWETPWLSRLKVRIIRPCQRLSSTVHTCVAVKERRREYTNAFRCPAHVQRMCSACHRGTSAKFL